MRPLPLIPAKAGVQIKFRSDNRVPDNRKAVSEISNTAPCRLTPGLSTGADVKP
jgi:hypothetical protein